MMNVSILKAVKAVSTLCGKRVRWTISPNMVSFGNSEYAIDILIDNFADPEKMDASGDSLASFELHMQSFGHCIGRKGQDCSPNIVANEWQTVEWVAIATDPDLTRYQLAGVLFTGDNVVATDGRRLHRGKLGLQVAPEGNLDKIVHSKAVSTVSKLLKAFKSDSLELKFRDNTFSVSTEDFTLHGILVEGRYPNWEMVIPSGKPNGHRASFTDSSQNYCEATVKRCKHEHQAAIAGLSAKQRKCMDEKIPTVEFVSDDGEVEMCLNAAFMADAIAMRGKSPTVSGMFWKDYEPILIDGGDRQAVLMPCTKEKKSERRETVNAA